MLLLKVYSWHSMMRPIRRVKKTQKSIFCKFTKFTLHNLLLIYSIFWPWEQARLVPRLEIKILCQKCFYTSLIKVPLCEWMIHLLIYLVFVFSRDTADSNDGVISDGEDDDSFPPMAASSSKKRNLNGSNSSSSQRKKKGAYFGSSDEQDEFDVPSRKRRKWRKIEDNIQCLTIASNRNC